MDIEKLGLATHHLLRYAFGGFFAALMAATVSHTKTMQTINALGPALAPIVALLVGAAIYVVYRYFLGEMALFMPRRLFQSLLHYFWDFPTTMSIIADAEVPFWRRQKALSYWRATNYAVLRRPLDAEKDYLRSAEIGMLYIAGSELLVTSLLASSDPWKWWVTGLVVLVIAICADIDHHQEISFWIQKDSSAPEAFRIFAKKPHSV